MRVVIIATIKLDSCSSRGDLPCFFISADNNSIEGNDSKIFIAWKIQINYG